MKPIVPEKKSNLRKLAVSERLLLANCTKQYAESCSMSFAQAAKFTANSPTQKLVLSNILRSVQTKNSPAAFDKLLSG